MPLHKDILEHVARALRFAPTVNFYVVLELWLVVLFLVQYLVNWSSALLASQVAAPYLCSYRSATFL